MDAAELVVRQGGEAVIMPLIEITLSISCRPHAFAALSNASLNFNGSSGPAGMVSVSSFAI
ncbi:MAG UNVERIFIED_CONTAM: hypothetical protein LVR18_12730 [Planctomycetaceae bacterium]